MNQKLITFIVGILLLTYLTQTVLAHPGGTDGKGGHTNHSTGEYHYHHGYSAHSHHDIDGDGKVDCPYDFKDATSHSDNSSAYSYSAPKISTIPSVVQTQKSSASEKSTLSADAKEAILHGIGGAIVCSLFLSVGFLYDSDEPFWEKILIVLAIALSGFVLGLVFYAGDVLIMTMIERSH